MKPVSLADISYEQGLVLLSLRKEAMDVGNISRMPAEALNNSYVLSLGLDKSAFSMSDLGSSLKALPGTASNYFKSLPAHQRNALLATAGGATLGGLGGALTTDPEKKRNRWRNALMGALSGGALGGGISLAASPQLQKDIVSGAGKGLDYFKGKIEELTAAKPEAPKGKGGPQRSDIPKQVYEGTLPPETAAPPKPAPSKPTNEFEFRSIIESASPEEQKRLAKDYPDLLMQYAKRKASEGSGDIPEQALAAITDPQVLKDLGIAGGGGLAYRLGREPAATPIPDDRKEISQDALQRRIGIEANRSGGGTPTLNPGKAQVAMEQAVPGMSREQAKAVGGKLDPDSLAMLSGDQEALLEKIKSTPPEKLIEQLQGKLSPDQMKSLLTEQFNLTDAQVSDLLTAQGSSKIQQRMAEGATPKDIAKEIAPGGFKTPLEARQAATQGVIEYFSRNGQQISDKEAKAIVESFLTDRQGFFRKLLAETPSAARTGARGVGLFALLTGLFGLGDYAARRAGETGSESLDKIIQEALGVEGQ